MEDQNSLKYISNRVRILMLFVVFFMSLFSAILFLQASGDKMPHWPVAVLVIVDVLLMMSLWWFVWIPFTRYEKNIKRFIDGYFFSDEKEKEDVMLTPNSKMMLERTSDILHSTNLYDLNKRQAQYLALQNQINPHFLYNTLESIRSEAIIAGLDSVSDMTEALAKFFRYTITKVENLVSVEEEIENCEIYFRIQQYRFGNRLKLHIEYDPDEWEEILQCRIPKLTLQPILENSIIHGTEMKIGQGNLKVNLQRTEKRLIIRISDDGVGMDKKTLFKLNEKLGRESVQLVNGEKEEQGGIALANVNNRIHLIFGEEYGMHVYSVQGKGTDVEISIPAITSDRELKNNSILQKKSEDKKAYYETGSISHGRGHL